MSNRSRSLPPRVPYPDAPWKLRGDIRAGLFSAGHVFTRPEDRVMWRSLAIVLARYKGGDLDYSELILGSVVRRGCSIGMFVRDIFVSDPVALWGGRDLWGTPKFLADFHWESDRVTVDDELGRVGEFGLTQRHLRSPYFYAPLVFVTRPDQSEIRSAARWSGKALSAGLEILELNERFARQATARPWIGLSTAAGRLVVR